MLIPLGIAEGIYKGHEQVPFWSSMTKEERKAMFGGGEEDEVPLGGDDDDEDEDDGAARSLVEDVKASGVTADIEKGPTTSGAEFLKALRKKCSNTMFVCVEVMSVDDLQNLVRMIVSLVRPV